LDVLLDQYYTPAEWKIRAASNTIDSRPVLLANSLCPGQENRTMHQPKFKSEIQIDVVDSAESAWFAEKPKGRINMFVKRNRVLAPIARPEARSVSRHLLLSVAQESP
jgi:hypothetical protein